MIRVEESVLYQIYYDTGEEKSVLYQTHYDTGEEKSVLYQTQYDTRGGICIVPDSL